jgi:hypothetical protein
MFEELGTNSTPSGFLNKQHHTYRAKFWDGSNIIVIYLIKCGIVRGCIWRGKIILPLGFYCKQLEKDYISKINAMICEMCLKCICKFMNPHPNYSETRHVKRVNELRFQQPHEINDFFFFLWNLDVTAGLFRGCQDSRCTATQVAYFHAARSE